MPKNTRRNTRNSNKNNNVSNKKPKTIPENDPPPPKPIEEVVSSSSNDKISPPDDSFIKNVPPENLFEKQKGKLPENTDLLPLNTPGAFKAPSWDSLITEDMNVDDEDDKLSVSSEFLRESAANNSQTAANSDENGRSDTNHANGDTTDDQTPIAKTLDDDDFIKVFK